MVVAEVLIPEQITAGQNLPLRSEPGQRVQVTSPHFRVPDVWVMDRLTLSVSDTNR